MNPNPLHDSLWDAGHLLQRLEGVLGSDLDGAGPARDPVEEPPGRWLVLAHLAGLAGRPEAARRYLVRAGTVAPVPPPLRTARGREGVLAAADVVARRAEAVGDPSAVGWIRFDLGTRHLEADEPADAILAFSAAERWFERAGEPDCAAGAAVFLGRALVAAGRDREAATALARATAAPLDPDLELGALDLLASALSTLGDAEAELPVLERVLAHAEGRRDVDWLAGARIRLGIVLLSLRRPAEARAHLTAALDLGLVDPEDLCAAWCTLGGVEQADGNAAAAEAAYCAALGPAGASATWRAAAYEERGAVSRWRQRYAAAADDLSRAARLHRAEGRHRRARWCRYRALVDRWALPVLAQLPRGVWRPDGYIGNPRRPGFTPAGVLAGVWLWIGAASFAVTRGAVAIGVPIGAHLAVAAPVVLGAAVLSLVVAVTVVERSLQP